MSDDQQRYKAKPGYRVTDQQANAFGLFIESVARRGVELEAAEVWREAKRPGSPVRDLYEWDTGKIHDQYGVERTKYLLRSYTVIECTVVYETRPDAPPIPIEVVTTPGERPRASGAVEHFSNQRAVEHVAGAYRPIEEVLLNYRGDFLERACGDFQAFVSKYQSLPELRPLFAAGNRVFSKFIFAAQGSPGSGQAGRGPAGHSKEQHIHGSRTHRGSLRIAARRVTRKTKKRPPPGPRS